MGNLVGGYFLWGDGVGMENVLAYVMGYVMVVLAVYIASPEVDIMAMIKLAREAKHGGLSKGQAKTSYGKSVLELITAYNELRHPEHHVPTKELVENTRASLKEALAIGVQSGSVKPDDLVDLSMQLWMHATNTDNGAAAVMQYFMKTPFFRQYCDTDPVFRAAMIGAMPKERRMSMAVGITSMHPMESTGSEIEVAKFLSY